ncbi:DEKNAAC101732 [Brettanomyces naardenensis]|uniref:D-lactate dehydratase n=1 Tax=Brettanomyces naardenensis TaxID=13370 RepID=A0A448YJ00_BRENA|nr:DEKNAAC101732 [Brettanomyces naardenensis]
MSAQKILVVVTNTGKYPTLPKATGLWLSEAVHFVDKVTKAGYKIDYVSPLGGYTPIDPNSLAGADEISFKYYQDRDFVDKLGTTLKPSEINPEDYFAIYFTGGHGVVFDFPNSKGLQEISSKIYDKGGYVTAVCHGSVGLANIKLPSGEYLVKGKKVTGFSNSEEQEVKLQDAIPTSTEDALKESGGLYSKANVNWESFAVADGRLISGENPASAGEVADKFLASLKLNKTK